MFHVMFFYPHTGEWACGPAVVSFGTALYVAQQYNMLAELNGQAGKFLRAYAKAC